MSRNYQQSWEFQQDVSHALYPEDYEDRDGCAAGCPLETSADSCLALVCPHRAPVQRSAELADGEGTLAHTQSAKAEPPASKTKEGRG